MIPEWWKKYVYINGYITLSFNIPYSYLIINITSVIYYYNLVVVNGIFNIVYINT